ncbi:MAG: hypothetical protein MRJ96_01105 [Nitrospirales bacterium]|nr:hypothetical protein [Nitrospira sp.]MDR4500040.1 hypothetical protein [Nitrospirales bacterium]
MTHFKSANTQDEVSPNEREAELQDSILSILHVNGSMSVEELVAQLPHCRWVEVLKAVSWLWGEEKLELEQAEYGIMIRSFGKPQYLGPSVGKLVRRSVVKMELTAS